MENRKMICDRCRSAVAVKDIRYVPKGKDSMTALCSRCRQETSVPENKTIEAGNVKKESAEKVSYKCDRCNYRFKFGHDGVTNLKCPYCGKDDKIREV